MEEYEEKEKKKELIYLICKIIADLIIVAGVIYRYANHTWNSLSLAMSIIVIVIGILFIVYEVRRYLLLEKKHNDVEKLR